MKKIILVLFLCLFTTNVFCEKNDPTTGADWKVIPYTAKVTYIVAFSEGYVVLEEGSKKYPFGYSYGALIDSLDKFYEDVKNEILPIPIVFHYVLFPALKESWSKEETENRAIEVLKWYKK